MSIAILNAEQLTCLASPVRNEVFVTLRSLGEASVREIAEAMGRTPEAIHYHVKALVRAGLAVERFRRPTAHKPEAVYGSTAERYQLPETPELAELTKKSVVAGLRQTIRGFETASANPETRAEIQVIRATARLSEEDAATFRRMLKEASDFARDRSGAEGERLVWSSVLVPVLHS